MINNKENEEMSKQAGKLTVDELIEALKTALVDNVKVTEAVDIKTMEEPVAPTKDVKEECSLDKEESELPDLTNEIVRINSQIQELKNFTNTHDFVYRSGKEKEMVFECILSLKSYTRVLEEKIEELNKAHDKQEVKEDDFLTTQINEFTKSLAQVSKSAEFLDTKRKNNLVEVRFAGDLNVGYSVRVIECVSDFIKNCESISGYATVNVYDSCGILDNGDLSISILIGSEEEYKKDLGKEDENSSSLFHKMGS